MGIYDRDYYRERKTEETDDNKMNPLMWIIVGILILILIIVILRF